MFITQRGLAVDKQSMRLHTESSVFDQAHVSFHRRPFCGSCGTTAPAMDVQAASAGSHQGVCSHNIASPPLHSGFILWTGGFHTGKYAQATNETLASYVHLHQHVSSVVLLCRKVVDGLCCRVV